jgi:hypothetical protein
LIWIGAGWRALRCDREALVRHGRLQLAPAQPDEGRTILSAEGIARPPAQPLGPGGALVFTVLAMIISCFGGASRVPSACARLKITIANLVSLGRAGAELHRRSARLAHSPDRLA